MLGLSLVLILIPLLVSALAAVPALVLAVAALLNPSVAAGLVAAELWVGTHIVSFFQGLFH